MKQIRRYLLSIVLINILLAATALIVVSIHPLTFLFKDVLTLSFFFSLIAVVTLIIFLRGSTREPDTGTMHTLVAFSL